MSDGDALLRAILAAPEDDAPRLVYADWLDEQGDAKRATFIRCQIELARLTADDPSRDRLVQLERTLWRENRAQWEAWVPHWAKVTEFRRGFLEEVRCDAASFLAGADELRRRTPLLGVQLDGPDQLAVPLFRSRVLEGLRSLRIGRGVPPAAWDVLADCRHLTRLQHLDIGFNTQPEGLIAALVSSQAFVALRSLRLKGCHIGDQSVCRIVSHPWSVRLHALDLGRNSITPAGAEALANSSYLSNLEWLNLRHNLFASDRRVVELLRQKFGSRVQL